MSIISGNGLASYRQQAITWTNDDSVHRCISASPELNEFTYFNWLLWYVYNISFHLHLMTYFLVPACFSTQWWRNIQTTYRDHFVYAPNQWETTLQCNVVSHWLGAFTRWSLNIQTICTEVKGSFICWIHPSTSHQGHRTSDQHEWIHHTYKD